MTREIEGAPKKPRAVRTCTHCRSTFTLPRSNTIDVIDPRGYFCTLRCAARYGVAAAVTRDFPAR